MKRTLFVASLSLSEERTHKKKVQKTLNPKQETKRALSSFLSKLIHTQTKSARLCAFHPHTTNKALRARTKRERD